MSEQKSPGQIRDEILNRFPEHCRSCLAARLAIGQLLPLIPQSLENTRLDAVEETMANCVDGPMLVGVCGTEKTVCAHPSADKTLVTNEQVVIMTGVLKEILLPDAVHEQPMHTGSAPEIQ